MTHYYVDEGFTASSESIDGRQIRKILIQSQKTSLCYCKKVPVLRQVYKNGPNNGRYYYSCSSKTCNLFAWGDSAPPNENASNDIRWERFTSDQAWCISVGSYSPSHVLQGSVGDCWWLSALAVIAERSDLIGSIVLDGPALPPNGSARFRLFLDGFWKEMKVDTFLPCKKTSKGRKGDTQFLLAYAKAKNSMLWVPLLEKAYAKAHGSYRAIHGGHIHEAFLDLTGAPCEVINFSCSSFDSELAWTRLLSFYSSKFPMGCSTAASGEGIVGCHAYSILDIQELRSVQLGVQTSLDMFFDTDGLNAYTGYSSASGSSSIHTSDSTDDIMAGDGTLRVLRIRNPWGHKEWEGALSRRSEMWTTKLASRLPRGNKNDGTFWITYHDFLRRFEQVDVCKAHRETGWHSASYSDMTRLKPSLSCASFFQFRVYENTWAYFSLIQKTKRGRNSLPGDRAYWYSPLSLVILRVVENTARNTEYVHNDDKDTYEVVGTCFCCPMRDTPPLELQLSRGRYIAVPLHFRPLHPTLHTSSLFYAPSSSSSSAAAVLNSDPLYSAALKNLSGGDRCESFVFRVYSSFELLVEKVPFTASVPPPLASTEPNSARLSVDSGILGHKRPLNSGENTFIDRKNQSLTEQQRIIGCTAVEDLLLAEQAVILSLKAVMDSCSGSFNNSLHSSASIGLKVACIPAVAMSTDRSGAAFYSSSSSYSSCACYSSSSSPEDPITVSQHIDSRKPRHRTATAEAAIASLDTTENTKARVVIDLSVDSDEDVLPHLSSFHQSFPFGNGAAATATIGTIGVTAALADTSRNVDGSFSTSLPGGHSSGEQGVVVGFRYVSSVNGVGFLVSERQLQGNLTENGGISDNSGLFVHVKFVVSSSTIVLSPFLRRRDSSSAVGSSSSATRKPGAALDTTAAILSVELLFYLPPSTSSRRVLAVLFCDKEIETGVGGLGGGNVTDLAFEVLPEAFVTEETFYDACDHVNGGDTFNVHRRMAFSTLKCGGRHLSFFHAFSM